MAVAATIKYFGRLPTTILMQTTDAFNGAVQAATPTITPGLYTFAPQAGGGLFAFHDEPVEIKQISYEGSGNLTVTKFIGPVASPVTSSVIMTIASGTPVNFTNVCLSAGEFLKFTNSGAGKVAVTSHCATYASDGG